MLRTTRRRSHSMGMLLAASLVVAACAGDGSDRRGDGSATSSPSLSTQGATTTTVPKGFERRDVPPAGVARQVSFYVGAGDADPACYGSPMPARPFPYLALADGLEQNDGPSSSSNRATIEVFQGAELCLVGFVPNKRVALRITSPEGDVERKSVIDKERIDASTGTYNYHSDYYFSRRPRDPVGIYEIVAKQGSLRGSLRIRLVPSSKPLMFYRVPDGDIEISGLRARQPLALNFYGGRDWTSLPPDPSTSNPMDFLPPYVGTMRVTLDANGQGTFPWPASLRQGCYGVDFKGYGRSRPLQCQG